MYDSPNLRWHSKRQTLLISGIASSVNWWCKCFSFLPLHPLELVQCHVEWEWWVTLCTCRASSSVSCATLNVKLCFIQVNSPLWQATELGQTLNENVIKPTQEKVTLMFEVVDLVACAAFRDDEITASDVNVLFSTLLVFSSICFMPAYIKRQKPQFFRVTNKRSNPCLHSSAESRLFGVVMSQWTLSTVTGDGYKVHLNTHLRAEVFVQIWCLVPRHSVKITPSSCSHENFINMLCFLKWQCNWHNLVFVLVLVNT